MVLIEEQLHVLQYHSIIYLNASIFSFSCSYTIRNIPGSQYLEYVDPGNALLGLYSFVFTGFRVDDATPPKNGTWTFCAGFRLHYRYRYRYRLSVSFGLVTIIIVIAVVIEVVLA